MEREEQVQMALESIVEAAKTKVIQQSWRDPTALFLAALVVMAAEGQPPVEEVAKKKPGRPRKEADAIPES